METKVQKSKIISVLILFLSSSYSFANERIDLDGHFRLRTEGRRDYTPDFSTHHQTLFRLRANVNIYASDVVSFHASPQFARSFGESEPDRIMSGTTNHPDIEFYQAYLKYRVVKNLDLKLGRQALSYGDELIIGSLNWANNARSFDAAKLVYEQENYQIDLFYSKISDNETPFSEGDDINFYGLYTNFDKFAHLIDLYLLHYKDSSLESTLEVNTFGTRIEGDLSSFRYHGEFTLQEGRNLGDDAYQSDIELSYDLKKSSYFVQYALAGKNYRQLFPTAHKFFGYADKFGRRNIQQIALGAKFNLTDNAHILAKYMNFKRADKNAPSFRINGVADWGNEGSSKNIGDEIDVVFDYLAKNNIGYQVGVSYFIPHGYMKAQSNNKDTTFAYFHISAGF